MKAALVKGLRALFRWLTPIRLAVVAICLALFWFLVLGDQGIYQLRRLAVMKHRLVGERAELNARIDALAREREELRDPANLEPIIRKELHYVKPGEVVFEEKKKQD